MLQTIEETKETLGFSGSPVEPGFDELTLEALDEASCKARELVRLVRSVAGQAWNDRPGEPPWVSELVTAIEAARNHLQAVTTQAFAVWRTRG